MRYQITQTASGADLGIYEGATEADALDALARDAGYDSYAAIAAAGIGGGDTLAVYPLQEAELDEES